MTKRTMLEIADRFEEAVETLRRLPSVRVCGYFNAWPEVVRSAAELLQMQKEKLRLGPPSSVAISRMEETLGWAFLLDDEEERRLIWMRAARVPWKIVCRIRCCGRTTAFHHWQVALLRIATALNAGESVRTENK